MHERRHAFWPRALRHRGFCVGAALLLLAGGAGLLSLAWTPWPAQEIALARKLLPPSAAHWLGTDALGRDILSQLMAGARNALLVGAGAAGLGLLLGAALGLVAAARRGWCEELIMRAADLGYAFPALLLAVLLAATLGPGLAVAVLAIALHSVPVYARLTRGAALAQWERDYVRAARASGLGPLAIARRHVLPNLLPLLIVQATLQFALAILAEAALSFLGLGSQPPEVSWGRMLAEAQSWLFQAPLLALWPGLAILATVLGLNLLGDALRDLLDPRLRE